MLKRALLFFCTLFWMNVGLCLDVDTEVIRSLKSQLNKTQIISVLHVPQISIGNGFYQKNAVRNNWIYVMKKKCFANCGKRNNKFLFDLLVNSLEMINSCPPPFNTLISLEHSDEMINLEIHFNITGHCFVINEKSYYSSKEFLPMTDFKKL